MPHTPSSGITLTLLDSSTAEAVHAAEIPCVPGRRYAPPSAHRLVGPGATFRLMWLLGIVFARRSTHSRLRASSGSESHGASLLASFEWLFVVGMKILLVLLALANAVNRKDREIADKYTASTSGPARDIALEKHRKLRRAVIRASIAAFTFAFAGLFVSAALNWMNFETLHVASFEDLFLTSSFASFGVFHIYVSEMISHL